VLEDDNLETMVIAISHGRTIYNNIRKSVHFLLATNLSEITVVGAALTAGLGQPLNAMQPVIPATHLSILCNHGNGQLGEGFEQPLPALARTFWMPCATLSGRRQPSLIMEAQWSPRCELPWFGGTRSRQKWIGITRNRASRGDWTSESHTK